MPKGRIGISGSGPFYRVRLPNNNEEAHTDEQRSPLSLVAIKDQVLLELEERRSTDCDSIDKEELWDVIIYAVGGYLGQAKQGLPPPAARPGRSGTSRTRSTAARATGARSSRRRCSAAAGSWR